MDLLDIIETKKHKQELSDEQIRFFARAAADKSALDYQLASLLMAIRLNGMSDRETAVLSLEMAKTGDVLDPQIDGIPVDKHSTGGVGDTTTLVLVPLVAACGGKVIKMSGRGLGHTGGTIDKMESIRGMRVEMPEEEFIETVKKVGCCVVGQSQNLVPADKRLYALRDVTGTVDAIPLIASSIMSKKLAGGAKAIVLDVKTGSGAIMKTFEDSLKLSKAMVDIGTANGRRVAAYITNMQEPLGSHVGNALEVKDAIDVLSGRTQGPLLQASLLLGAQMLVLSSLAKDEEEGKQKLLYALETKAGLNKFKEMIEAQGGDPAVCDDVSLLPQAAFTQNVKATKSGYIHKVDAERIGLAAQALGAGRRSKEDVLDLSAGLVMHKRIGDKIQAGDSICTLYFNGEKDTDRIQKSILDTVEIISSPVDKPKLICAKVTEKGTEIY
ncbi:MAG: thymidine phosphorylase [Eubacteriales bacterium]|nr:thymidine phosphorylase [Eubacteriales bacterium]